MATFTVGVFQDAAWAKRGIAALVEAGFPPESMTLIAKASPDMSKLVEDHLGGPPQQLDVKSLGTIVARGPMLRALDGEDKGLASEGIGGTIGRAGFQAHDGYIFETLVGRGGVLISVHNEPRAADALAKLHAYGAGNAAIGAWNGRV
jgi:hypothetical protein